MPHRGKTGTHRSLGRAMRVIDLASPLSAASMASRANAPVPRITTSCRNCMGSRSGLWLSPGIVSPTGWSSSDCPAMLVLDAHSAGIGTVKCLCSVHLALGRPCNAQAAFNALVAARKA